MVVAAEQSRSATLMAVAALLGSEPEVRRRDVSAAKALVGRNGRAVTEAAIQLHGGIGFTWEHHAHLYFKRARSSSTWLGTPEEHRETVARIMGLDNPAETI
jgi:alkylation response protein AidB-like acyl-CoA dehydrogenase